ncbi:ufm1-specific protease 2-like [Acanthaster planci]|uniref:Ufm1-specific protease 2-like n=1 Tax=Acanthaster planci TaxID=133434 RepID=A0A8B7Z276_ACAPL|nr:ufm1-specific protease 2-like [Acanthaster planci]
MAAPTVFVSRNGIVDAINQVLKEPVKQVSGFLLGSSNDGQTTLLQCSAIDNTCDLTNSVALCTELEKLHGLLPVGIDVCGLYFVSTPPGPASVTQYCKELIDDTVHTALHTDQLIIAKIPKDQPELVPDNFYLYDVNSAEASPCQVKIGNDTGIQENNLMTFRVQGNLSLNVVYHDDKDLREALTQKFTSLCNRVQSFTALYHFQKTSILIGGNSGDITAGPLNRDSQAGDICRHIQEEDDGFSAPVGKGGKKTKKEDRNVNQILEVQLLFRLSLDEEQEGSAGLVPFVHYQIYNEECRRSSMVLPIDVPVIVPRNTLAATLGKLFSAGVCRQLLAMEQCLKDHLQECGLSVPRPYHYKLPGIPNLFTVLYPVDLADDKLGSTRQHLHNQFLLPLDRPRFRRANAYSYPDAKKEGYLLNTHLGLPLSGVGNGQVSLVQGTYAYHHYMQDHFNDDKWGCAYRSLQTLVSWFRHQGYTQRPVPSHKEIQQALVDVGDKPAKFVGSRQWIGSFEVSTVLNQLFAITCKLLYVSSGAEMANKGRELALHFQTQGTPIMIGGGVLAHTILGVDFSESSGDIKFLILDPHYTGSEDLKVVQDKGWCGWKGVDFWDQTAYYNMCMPQRPIEF